MNISPNNPKSTPSYASRTAEACKAALFFILVLGVFFYPAVLQNKLIYSGDLTGSDLLELNIPRRVLTSNAVRDGEIPLWEPKLGCGLPLLAEGQSAPFYPTTIPLYLTFSITRASNLNILSTLLIALLGSYALIRAYKIHSLPAVLGAVSFGLGGIFIFRLKHLNLIQVIAWLPWSLFALRCWWLTGRRGYLPLFILSGVMQILAGHPHACYICWLTCYIYGLVLYWEQPRQPNTGRTWYHLLGIMLISSAAAILLCSIQLLPTWELTKISTRSAAVSWDELRVYPLKIKHFLTLIYPFYFGSPADGSFNRDINNEGLFWDNAVYFGVIPFLTAATAVLWPVPKRKLYPVLGLTLLFAWSALGPSGGIYWLFWKLCPLFNLFRFPSRLLIPAVCFAGIAAAWGCQCLYDCLCRRGGRRTASAVCVILIALTLAELFNANRLYQCYLPSSWENAPAPLALLGSRERVFAPTYIFTWDKILGHRGWYRNEDRVCHNINTMAPDLAAIWGVDCPSDRIVFDGGNELWHYFDVQAWQFSNIGSSFETNNGELQSFDIFPGLIPWLRLQSISHVVSFVPLRNPGTNPGIAGAVVFRDPQHPELPPLYIYALRSPQPKARLISPELTEELPEYAKFIRDNYPSYQAGSLYEPSEGGCSPIGTAAIQHEGHNSLTISTECSRDSFLIVSNTYHPNWRISIDDSPPVPVTRVNYAFQGAPVPAGRHQITLRFTSPAFDLGWKISAAVLLFLLAACGRIIFKPGAAAVPQTDASERSKSDLSR